MGNLTYREKLFFEELFNMDSGYVLDFSNATFARFIVDSVNIEIYEGFGYEEYSSKESDAVVGILMDELLTYYEDLCSRRKKELSELEIKKINELRSAINRLKGANVSVNLPKKFEETLQHS